MLTENTHYGAEGVRQIMENCRGVFFIGIGGINMSSLAHLTHASGYVVAGSDRTRSALCERLEGEGIRISYEHKAENIEGCDVIVYTVAIPDDTVGSNPASINTDAHMDVQVLLPCMPEIPMRRR